MALQKPIINSVAAFDATSQHIFNFVVNGGDEVASNRLVIKLGSTNEILYDETQTTLLLQHILPANTLTNGNYYTVQVQTFNSLGTASSLSSPVSFYCYTTPQFSLSNLPAGDVLSNAEYSFSLSYNQAEGESLNSYTVNIYDSSQNLIWTSNVNYVGANGLPPSNFATKVAGFEDGKSYYVRAVGQTEQFTQLDTGYILLTTSFSARNIYTQLVLDNNSCDGYISITSNLISLDGVANPDPPIYIDNEEIDLNAQNSYVTWENSFAVYDSYTARIWLRNINTDSIILTFYNANNPEQNLTLYEREETINNTVYMYIEGYYGDAQSIEGYIYSNKIAKPNSDQILMVWVQKNQGMYDLSIVEVEE